MQHEAYSMISEIFQPKMFNLIPFKLLDFTAKLQETNLTTRKQSEKSEGGVFCRTAALLSSASQCHSKGKDRPWEI